MLRRLPAVVALLLLVLLAGAPTASAHAYLDASNPADGSVLDSAPSRLTLTFDEDVVASATTLTLVSSDGSRRTLGPIATDAVADPSVPPRISAPLPPLGRGAYQVTWSTVSADDLHPTGGTFGFGIGVAVTAVGWTETAPSALEGALRSLLLLGLLAVVAAPFAARLLRQADPTDRRAMIVLHRTAGATAVVAALAGAASLADELLAQAQSPAAVVLSRYGAWWGLRESALLVAAVALLPLGRRRPFPAAVVTVCGILAAGATAELGHSGSGATGSPVRAALATGHVLATAAWLGTLTLVVVVLAVRRPEGEVARRVLRGFAPVAVAGVAGTAVTGLALAGGVVGSLDALVLTDYGRLLLAKVTVVAVLLVLGLLNHRRVRREGAGPTRWIALEVVGGLLVVVLTGLLTSGQPATERQLQLDPAAPSSTLLTRKVGDLQEELTLRPNLPGRNVAVVRVADTRRPSPGPVSSVSVGVVDAVGRVVLVPAAPLGDGRWSAAVDLPQWGPADLRVVVTRRGVAAASSADLGWTVAAPPGTPAVVLSRAPLGGPSAWSAWALGVLVVLGSGLWLRRGRRLRTAERSLAARAAALAQGASAAEGEPEQDLVARPLGGPQGGSLAEPGSVLVAPPR